MWLLKIIVKTALSRLPFGYRLWRRVGIFRHGMMHNSDYATNVVKSRIKGVGETGKTWLELGPGDSLASAVIAHAYGAERTILVDVGEFADKDISRYRDLAAMYGLELGSSIDDLLAKVGGEYHTRGLESLRQLESDSVDFIWSQAVLEHIRVAEVKDVFVEFYRILRPGGAASHEIDYRDHLDCSLNNLRFPTSMWETDFMAGSGFYTNRLRHSDMVKLMTDAGFKVDTIKKIMWDKPPLPRQKLAGEFRDYTDDDLRIYAADVVAYKQPAHFPTRETNTMDKHRSAGRVNDANLASG